MFAFFPDSSLPHFHCPANILIMVAEATAGGSKYRKTNKQEKQPCLKICQ